MSELNYKIINYTLSKIIYVQGKFNLDKYITTHPNDSIQLLII